MTENSAQPCWCCAGAVPCREEPPGCRQRGEGPAGSPHPGPQLQQVGEPGCFVPGMFNLCSLGPRGQKLRSAELSCGGPEGTTKHQHWGAPALSHPQPQGTGARSRARDTSPDAFDISRMAGEWGQGSLQPPGKDVAQSITQLSPFK